MRVFVISQNQEPLNSCHPAKARKLLSSGRAAVWKRYPFTIILKQEVKKPIVTEHRLKIDPGSRVTGLAILEGNRVAFAAEPGIEYQQGELFGYEVREYLLDKWNRKCAYCGVSGVPLQIEHIYPKSKGGSNRISNLCLACESCNLKKGTQSVEQFLKKKPDVLQRILAQAKRPLKDTAAVNSTRWALQEQLRATGLPVETGTGGRTKFNRTRLGLPKTHWLDAASVGQSTPENLITRNINPLVIKATGHGHRKMAQINKFGFPRRKKDGSHSVRTRTKEFHGFKTGDIVRAIVPTGKNQGTHIGRVTVRAYRVFDLTTVKGKLQSINWKYFESIWKTDGYAYVHTFQK
ncbi:RNA-guided endonuclease IscB [Coleofasciculus sp.]|uniref:RNA-guided endonuclease IscB n=1 Tax=Coleofasciculus sp. TaxID=3100458 RepID=UPI0039F90D9B